MTRERTFVVPGLAEAARLVFASIVNNFAPFFRVAQSIGLLAFALSLLAFELGLTAFAGGPGLALILVVEHVLDVLFRKRVLVHVLGGSPGQQAQQQNSNGTAHLPAEVKERKRDKKKKKKRRRGK